jgi:MFS family permease
MTTTDRPCAFPPHPDSAGHQHAPPAAAVRPPAVSRFRGWLAHAPAERAPLPAIPVIWTAAEILHAAGVQATVPAVAAAVAALGGGWLGDRRARDPERARLRGAEVAAVTGAVGGWVTAATAWGPLAGPDHLMTLAYLAGTGGGYWWLRRHDAVRAARARRDAAAAWTQRKTDWHRLARLPVPRTSISIVSPSRVSSCSRRWEPRSPSSGASRCQSVFRCVHAAAASRRARAARTASWRRSHQ